MGILVHVYLASFSGKLEDWAEMAMEINDSTASAGMTKKMGVGVSKLAFLYLAFFLQIIAENLQNKNHFLQIIGENLLNKNNLIGL